VGEGENDGLNFFLFGHCAKVNNFLAIRITNEEENGNQNASKVRYKVIFFKKLFVPTKS
jgi:hypothetical protein